MDAATIKTDAFPVDEESKAARAKAFAAAVELGKSVGYDIETDIDGYWKVFSEFDADGMCTIDHKEFKMMIESLGRVMTKSELNQMVKEADTDNSNDIDFAEFYKVVNKPTGPLPSLFRAQRTAIKMKWWKDRTGKGVVFDGTTASKSGPGFATVLLDKWLGEERMVRGSCLLEIDAPAGQEVWVGLVGLNFKSEGEHWSQAITTASNDPNKDNEKNKMCLGVRSKDGHVFRHGSNLTDPQVAGLKLQPFGLKGSMRMQIEVSMSDMTVTFRVLDETKDQDEVANLTVDQIKSTTTVAVCFGETPEGAPPTTVRVVGSSAEVGERKTRRASKDLLDDDQSVGLNHQMGGGGAGVGMGETFGS